MIARLLDVLALYLAQPVKRPCAAGISDPQDLAAVLLPGDVLLSDGNSRMAALVRRVTRSSWAHAAMYVGPLESGTDPRCIVEADVAAGVRAVRLSELKDLRVRVLRHAGLDERQRQRLAGWVVSRIGGQYDLPLALALARRLLWPAPAARRAQAPEAMAQGASRFICSTLLAQAFLLAGYPIVADSSYVMPRDFESAASLQPVAPE
jgi:Permuted papain-like amidase enzyme, YaeF/YiiX, C92 family